MNNKTIAKAFQFLGAIMELHGENPYKVRSYQNAYLTLRKLDQPLASMDPDAVAALKGVGPAISSKIQELLQTGKMEVLERYRAQTPPEVQEMLEIKGFGPKKIRVIWQELGIETIGELLYAVNENRLLELKGFGPKTQQELRQQLEYYLRARHQFHYATLAAAAEELSAALTTAWPEVAIAWTGALRRCCNVLESIELVLGQLDLPLETWPGWQFNRRDAAVFYGQTLAGYPVVVYTCAPESFGAEQFLRTGTPAFLTAWGQQPPASAATEAAIFAAAQCAPLPPELREDGTYLPQARNNALPNLVEVGDIKGIVHAHSTYSDGAHTLAEMAHYVRDQGYGYLVITDHSKAAFYANGLSEERVQAQMAEIAALNAQLAPFRIFKGIECDILNDGQLDYAPDVLAQFEVVIASVHSNLRMDEAKATQRILTAIANPYTTILGHPTGRLLLSRPGYPVDHRRLLQACAENGVAIELNASPYRLDLDWTWIPLALELGVKIAINPDAHSREGIHDVVYGVASARKGGLAAANCLNTLSAADFAAWLAARQQAR